MHCTPEEELLFLCNLFGNCSKRSQGAGGNISVKHGNHIYIKASGVRLNSVRKKSGYVICDLSGVLKLFHQKVEQLDSTVLFGSPQKPSMETFMHLMGSRYVVHFHPSFLCKFLCSKESPEIFTKKQFPRSLYIPYVKPGLKLANTIFLDWKGESVLFLENHGIVILGDTIESLITEYRNVIKTLEQITGTQDSASPIDIEYILTKQFGCSVKPVYSLKELPPHFFAISPDHFLFLQSALFTNFNELDEDIFLWKNKCEGPPSFVQVDTNIYALGKSWEECLNKEEYLLSYLEILTPDSTTLSSTYQRELLQCPKEKFRLQK
jgi:ribulose-5-phosphate 4-epimerase/fuculose-1-phosphate aldolase